MKAEGAETGQSSGYRQAIVLAQREMKKRLKAELQRRKHHRTTEVGAWLRKVVLGYHQYHASSLFCYSPTMERNLNLRTFCPHCKQDCRAWLAQDAANWTYADLKLAIGSGITFEVNHSALGHKDHWWHPSAEARAKILQEISCR